MNANPEIVNERWPIEIGLEILEATRARDERLSLDAIAGFAGVSHERIRQIELKALRKLRKLFHVRGIDPGDAFEAFARRGLAGENDA